MIIRILFIIILALFHNNLWAACEVNGTNLTAASASQTDVVACVDIATYGDTINIPSGSATWTATSQGCTGDSMLCMKKGVRLIGAGESSTVITLSGTATYGAICYEPDAISRANNQLYEVSGLTITGGGAGWAEGMLTVRNSSSTIISNIKIHNCKFTNTTSTAISINGPVYGVIYSNTFTDDKYPIRSFGGDVNSWGLSGANVPREYGTNTGLFIEDNTFNFTKNVSGPYFETGQGQPGWIFRYNTLDLNGQSGESQIQDLHGLQSMTVVDSDACTNLTCGDTAEDTCYPERKCCQQWSQIKAEYYGNIFTNVNAQSVSMVHRGSWLMMYNNKYTGSTNPVPRIWQYSCDSCQSGEGTRYSMHVQNTYIWNNQTNGTRQDMDIADDRCKDHAGNPYAITENTDFFNYNELCTKDSCSSGIGIGTDTPTGTCTEGVGYWKWDQGTTLPATISDMKIKTQSGTFYKCTATNTWTPYYTPYTYPHPLRVQKFSGNTCVGCGGFYN